MTTTHNGISIQITLHLAPESVPAFLEACKPVHDQVRAEPQLRSFEMYQAMDSPGTISWTENWDASLEWIMETQLAKEYYKEFLAFSEALYIKPREVKVLNRIKEFYFAKDAEA